MKFLVLVTLVLGCVLPAVAEESWPALPEQNGSVQIPAQEWPLKPGPRTVKVTVHYPDGKLQGVTERTGLMLSLHNWGGTGCVGTADPVKLTDQFNVVCLCVDYLQSGKKASLEDPEPYDFGYLQALDALRALYWLRHSLVTRKVAFDPSRIYSTGGSGGGNVTLMVNKLAPRTFACCVDMCGMAKLSDDIAFNLPGGSDLNARYSRDKSSPYYLSPDHQELRYVGNPAHLKIMRTLGNRCRVIVIHGVDDTTCPVADARAMVANMQAAQLTIRPEFVVKGDLEGGIFTSSGHALGDRTVIVFEMCGRELLTDSPNVAKLAGPTDFERREDIVYPTTNGRFVISYAKGYPVGRFETSTK